MASPDARIPPEVETRLAVAEGRLYSAVLTDPEGFERATILVGLVAGELRRECADIPAVLARREAMVAGLPALAEARGADLAAVSAVDVVDAASALRCRELQAGTA